jgi:2OG-Fe(II) oxygenase superfamily
MLRHSTVIEIPETTQTVNPICLEVDSLTAESLTQLLSGDLLAIKVKGFYPATIAEDFANQVLAHPTKAGYEVDRKISRTGRPFCDTVGKPSLRQEYLDRSMHWMREEFHRFSYRAPICAVLLELMAIWLHGIQFENLGGKAMWAGSARIFDQVGALPHRDNLGVDAPEFRRASELMRQIAVNVYVRLPEEGGELELWHHRLTEEEYNDRRIYGSYGLDRRHLPSPTATIRPELGDLILFDSNRIHAVRASSGLRIAHSCFLGLHSFDTPLSVWS